MIHTLKSLQTMLEKIFQALKSPKKPQKAIAFIAEKYLDFYNGFSYDFLKNGEEELINKFRKFQPKVVFDVGANVGEWTNIALASYPLSSIHCFEISQKTYNNLTLNIQNNRAILNNFGLSNVDGIFDYKDYGEDSGANTILLSATHHDTHIKPNLVTAQLRLGDDYCLQGKIEFIDFLKIDVEGAEHLVLAGFEKMLKKKAIRLIQFEYGYTNGDSRFLMRDFYEFFVKLGYIVGRVQKGGITFEKWTYKNNDFNSGPNYVAIRDDDVDLRKALGLSILRG